MTDTWLFLVAIGVPSAAVGFGMWMIKRQIAKSDAVREARENAREEHQLLMLRSSCVSLKLGIATAEAVRDGHCNGNVSKALQAADAIKSEQELFLQKQGVISLL